ncbi:MAG TPA: outer membrane beta-barrel protein [Polyangia bacterium]|nr:outer membrane beta-barrel protein [Polyangia bacterium]
MPAAEKPTVPQEPAATPAPAAPVVVAPAPAPAPAAAPPAGPSPKFTFGGLVDTYYLYNFTPPTDYNSLQFPQGVGAVGRAFDTNANSFTLALAKLTMNASLDPVSFQLDLGYGSVGTIINNTVDGLPSMSAQTGNNFLLEQAYGEIALPGNLTLDFGKFATTAGAEVIEANKNWLYSRSLLFNIIPLVHTGLRAGLKVNDQLTLQASVVNGWNNDPDLNAWKTVGLSASFTANPMLSAVLTTYFGKEQQPQPAPTGATPGDLRFLLDLVVAATINSQFGLNLNVDYIKAFDDISSDYQVGASLMGRYVVSDHLNVAARGEFLATHYDAAAMLGSVTVKQGEGTVMVGIDVGKNFELRPELRADFAGEVQGQKVLEGGAKSVAFTGEIAALTWF